MFLRRFCRLRKYGCCRALWRYLCGSCLSSSQAVRCSRAGLQEAEAQGSLPPGLEAAEEKEEEQEQEEEEEEATKIAVGVISLSASTPTAISTLLLCNRRRRLKRTLKTVSRTGTAGRGRGGNSQSAARSSIQCLSCIYRV